VSGEPRPTLCASICHVLPADGQRRSRDAPVRVASTDRRGGPWKIRRAGLLNGFNAQEIHHGLVPMSFRRSGQVLRIPPVSLPNREQRQARGERTVAKDSHGPCTDAPSRTDPRWHATGQDGNGFFDRHAPPRSISDSGGLTGTPITRPSPAPHADGFLGTSGCVPLSCGKSFPFPDYPST